MKGPRGIAKEVVYHFTADDLRKRLKLPDGATMTVETLATNGDVIALDATVRE